MVNSEVILSRMSVRDGRIVLPDGISYASCCFRTGSDAVGGAGEGPGPGGGRGHGRGPKASEGSGLGGFENKNRQLNELADELWGTVDGKAC